MQHHLAHAAEQTLGRIRKDQKKAPERLRAIFAHLEEHLFDPGLNADQLMREVGIRSNTVSARFRAVVGLPPYAYIEDCRMEIAERLVRHTDWQTAADRRLGDLHLRVRQTVHQVVTLAQHLERDRRALHRKPERLDVRRLVVALERVAETLHRAAQHRGAVDSFGCPLVRRT